MYLRTNVDFWADTALALASALLRSIALLPGNTPVVQDGGDAMVRIVAGFLALLLLTPGRADAEPGPGIGIEAVRLHLRIRRGAVERMYFISGDERAPFPKIGSTDDPRTADLDVEIFTAAGQSSAFSVREGGYEGATWKVRNATRGFYKYKNRLAPAGHGFIKKFLMKEGRTLKVVARRHQINLRTPQGTVILRLTMGDLRMCSHFIDPVFDGVIPGRDEDSTSFFSRTGVALADCTDATIAATLGTTFD
jgi:hypothetical protein